MIIFLVYVKSWKLNALARIALFIGLPKRGIFMSVFLNFQRSYCPLIWMCQCGKNNGKINRLHERCLCIIYNDKQSSLSELLEKDGSVSIHMRNIQSMTTEMFFVGRNLSPPIINDTFTQTDNSRYNLRQIFEFSRVMVKPVYHGSDNVSFLVLKM